MLLVARWPDNTERQCSCWVLPKSTSFAAWSSDIHADWLQNFHSALQQAGVQQQRGGLAEIASQRLVLPFNQEKIRTRSELLYVVQLGHELPVRVLWDEVRNLIGTLNMLSGHKRASWIDFEEVTFS